MKRRNGSVVYHMEKSPLNGHGRLAIVNVLSSQAPVLATARQRLGPGHELHVDLVHTLNIVQLLIGEHHHGAISGVIRLHVVTDED